MMRLRRAWLLGILAMAVAAPAAAEDPPLARAFRAEVDRIAAEPLEGIDSAEAWKARRPELQRQLREMLGLDPWPEKTDLEAEVRRTVERPDFVVETVLFQSLPGLYVTGDLYRPKATEGRLPAVLYVCGHAQVEKDGVIFGNKAHYQHHAAWFAANGYVCLVVDTLQLGEVPGLHHGTYREGMWWWQSRGYTPAGVETWNGIRAIDYLLSRPEVDPDRIGVTGRSGGGATSWWLGALDDRLAAVVPVAGITDLHDHVVAGDDRYPDGVIEGHCDCMFMVNTYRWDFSTVAALVAPKPLLVENTDHDPIFPEAGVRRIFADLERVYEWYGARDRLGLVIGEGGHVDSEELRHAAFAFMERCLKGKEAAVDAIEEPDRAVPIEDLKVLKPGEVPEDSRNATIQESFVPEAEEAPVPETAQEWARLRESWLDALRSKVFGGWPTEPAALNLALRMDATRDGVRLRVIDVDSQEGVRLRILVGSPAGGGPPGRLTLMVADETLWQAADEQARAFLDFANDPDEIPWTVAVREQGEAMAAVAPRGVGPTAWPDAKEPHLRRRFALLGQTLDGMRVWDVRRALAALRQLDEFDEAPLRLEGTGPTAAVALWAAVFEPEVDEVRLNDPPATVREGPAFLNLARILNPPEALALLYPRPVMLDEADRDAWSWASRLAEALGSSRPWPTFLDAPGK